MVTQLTDIADDEDKSSTSSMASTIVPENMEGDATGVIDDKDRKPLLRFGSDSGLVGT